MFYPPEEDADTSNTAASNTPINQGIPTQGHWRIHNVASSSGVSASSGSTLQDLHPPLNSLNTSNVSNMMGVQGCGSHIGMNYSNVYGFPNAWTQQDAHMVARPSNHLTAQHTFQNERYSHVAAGTFYNQHVQIDQRITSPQTIFPRHVAQETRPATPPSTAPDTNVTLQGRDVSTKRFRNNADDPTGTPLYSMSNVLYPADPLQRSRRCPDPPTQSSIAHEQPPPPDSDTFRVKSHHIAKELMIDTLRNQVPQRGGLQNPEELNKNFLDSRLPLQNPHDLMWLAQNIPIAGGAGPSTYLSVSRITDDTTSKNRLRGRFVSKKTMEEHQERIRENNRFDHSVVDRKTVVEYLRYLGYFIMYCGMVGVTSIFETSAPLPPIALIKGFIEMMASDYRQSNGDRLAYTTLEKVLLGTLTSLEWLKGKAWDPSERQQAHRRLRHFQGDPNLNLVVKSKKMPCMDVSDARTQIQALFHPNRVWITRSNHNPRSNHDRISTVGFISICLLLGVRGGETLKTSAEEGRALQHLVWGDLDLIRGKHDRYGPTWVLMILWRAKKNHIYDGVDYTDWLHTMNQPHNFSLDAVVYILAMGLKRGVFERFQDVEGLFNDRHAVIKVKEDFKNKPVFVTADPSTGSPTQTPMTLTSMRETLQWLFRSLGYKVDIGNHKFLTTYAFQKNMGKTLLNDPKVAAVDHAHQMGWQPSGVSNLAEIYNAPIRIQPTALHLGNDKEFRTDQTAARDRLPDDSKNLVTEAKKAVTTHPEFVKAYNSRVELAADLKALGGNITK
ncbi:hypothetical protein FRC03_004176, partial [Tulasnella sp. 419]